jgi:endo-1,4-beta-xylanase
MPDLPRLRLLLLCASLTASCFAQSLRERADSLGFLVGTAVRPYALPEQLYSATRGREFNMIEAEDAMKWWVLRPDQATFDFTQADRVVGFAETHRMKVRGHTLVWGWTNPAWLTSRTFTPEQLAALLREHIARVAGHFRGKVFAWDVLNEGFDEKGRVKPSIWYDRLESASRENPPPTSSRFFAGPMKPIPARYCSITTAERKP